MSYGELLPRIGRDFLVTELKIGLNFARLALNDRVNLDRHLRNARKAYDSFLRFRPRVDLTDAEGTELQDLADQLKQALRDLGERIG